LKAERLILGIDPGTNLMGYGILKVRGKEVVDVVISGVVDMKKLGDPYLKLRTIFKRVTQIIDEYLPDELAIESQFFGVNVQSMLKLGRAQGVAIAAAVQRDIPIYEYAPKKIKMSITGSGNASKEQIAILLPKLLKVKITPRTFDETDALAIAYCHLIQSSAVIKSNKTNNWSDFIKKNPQRVK
jgi:crossover junction endodeoxyribonuclease RuvC